VPSNTCRSLCRRSVYEAKYLNFKELVQQSQFPIACYVRNNLPLQAFLWRCTLVKFSKISPTRAGSYILQKVGSSVQNAKVPIFPDKSAEMRACGTGRKFAEYNQRDVLPRLIQGENWGGVYIHIFMFTYHKNNRFQKKSASGRTRVYEYTINPPPPIVVLATAPIMQLYL
jgi:hypothetical protein